DMKARLVLKSQGNGRIWRITTAKEGTKPPRVKLDKASVPELVKALDNDNDFWRRTAQRLLFQRREKTAVVPLKALARGGSPAGRILALSLLPPLGQDDPAALTINLASSNPGLREAALRLAAQAPMAERLSKAVEARIDDKAGRVRFQAALTLGAIPGASTT